MFGIMGLSGVIIESEWNMNFELSVFSIMSSQSPIAVQGGNCPLLVPHISAWGTSATTRRSCL